MNYWREMRLPNQLKVQILTDWDNVTDTLSNRLEKLEDAGSCQIALPLK